MSNKKHRKRKPKGRTRDAHAPSARAGVGQSPLTPPMAARQALAAKPGKPALDEAISKRLGPDLRRALLSSAIVLLVLVILYLVLR